MQFDYEPPIELTTKRVRKQPFAFIYDMYYNEDLDDPNLYLDDYEVFSTASTDDIIRMHINNQGGRMDILVQLVNAMRSTQATIMTMLEGEANSAAGALFLQGDQYVIGSNTSLMIHEATFGSLNSSDKVFRHVDFTKKQNQRTFRDMYKHFLSEEEIEDVLAGHDLWLDEDEIKKRLEIKVQKIAAISKEFTSEEDDCKV